MNHLLLDTVALNFPLVLGSKCVNIDTISVDCDEIFVFAKEEARDLGLPELEGFVPEHGPLELLRYVPDHDGVCIHHDGLVAHDQLFILLLLISNHEDISIRNVKPVFQLKEELVFFWIEFVKNDQEESEFSHVLIAHHIEHPVFMVMDDCLDVRNFEVIIKVYENSSTMVEGDAVILGGND